MCAQKLFNFPSLNTILVGLGLVENETLVKVAEHSFIIENTYLQNRSVNDHSFIIVSSWFHHCVIYKTNV